MGKCGEKRLNIAVCEPCMYHFTHVDNDKAHLMLGLTGPEQRQLHFVKENKIWH